MNLNYWSWDTFFDALPVVLQGLGITIGLTFASYLFALIFGFFVDILTPRPKSFYSFHCHLDHGIYTLYASTCSIIFLSITPYR